MKKKKKRGKFLEFYFILMF